MVLITLTLDICNQTLNILEKGLSSFFALHKLAFSKYELGSKQVQNRYW